MEGLNLKVAETVDFQHLLVSRDTAWSFYRLRGEKKIEKMFGSYH